MDEQTDLPGTPPAIRPYMTRKKAVEILSHPPRGNAITLDGDFYDALQFAIASLITEERRTHPVLDPRD